MIVLDNGDAIRGIAEVASKLSFTISGYVGTVATQLAKGQIASTEGDLYASGADATVVTSITVVNTDSVARTFTLYFLESGGGTSWAISPVSLDLGIGYCFYTDGQRMVVLDANGAVQQAYVTHDLGGAAHTADTLANLNAKISDATLVDTASIVLKALFDAHTILIAVSDDTPAKLDVAASSIVGRASSGNIVALDKAGVLTIINVTEGANVNVYADAAEVNTGTEASKSVSPDALAGSKIGSRVVYITVLADDTALTTGDGKKTVTIPIELNGMNLVLAHACVYTKSSSGLPEIELERSVDQGSNWTVMLSTLITIDENEFSSYVAATPPVIDTGEDDVATGYWIRINVDTAGTGTKGLDVILTFQLP